MRTWPCCSIAIKNMSLWVRSAMCRSHKGFKRLPGAKELPELVSREHYLRVLYGENLWLYFGFLDKVYGIRNVNHTAFSRVNLGLAQNDQSHGVIADYIQPTYEFSVNLFGGNLYQEDANVRQQGASVLYEQEVKEAVRVGTSALYSTSKYLSNARVGVFGRYGFGYGSALLGEIGLLQDKPKSRTKSGYYLYSEATQRIVRGFHLFFVAQMFKDRMQGNRPDKMRTGAGVCFGRRNDLSGASRSKTDVSLRMILKYNGNRGLCFPSSTSRYKA